MIESYAIVMILVGEDIPSRAPPLPLEALHKIIMQNLIQSQSKILQCKKLSAICSQPAGKDETTTC
jgi:hypothetical protein